jgi:hypothetical protein
MGYSNPSDVKNLQLYDLGLRDLGHLKHRLLSLRLNSQQHPLPNDSIAMLVWAGLSRILNEPGLSGKAKLRLSLWFLWVGASPLGLIQPLLSKRRLQPLTILKALRQWGWHLLAYLKPILQRI